MIVRYGDRDDALYENRMLIPELAARLGYVDRDGVIDGERLLAWIDSHSMSDPSTPIDPSAVTINRNVDGSVTIAGAGLDVDSSTSANVSITLTRPAIDKVRKALATLNFG